MTERKIFDLIRRRREAPQASTSAAHQPPKDDRWLDNAWSAARSIGSEFQELLQSGSPQTRSLAEFGRTRIAPFLNGAITYHSFSERLEFFYDRLATATRNKVDITGGPKWTIDAYPRDAIEAAEELYLDREVFPRVFPDLDRARLQAPQTPKLRGLSQFPQVVSRYLQMDEASFNRIMTGTDQIWRQVALSREHGQSPDELQEILSKRGKEDIRKYDSSRDNKWRKFEEGLHSVAYGVMPDVMAGVVNTTQLRQRLDYLTRQLEASVDTFNRKSHSVYHIRSDFQHQYADKVTQLVRAQYLTALFIHAFPQA